MAVIRSIHAVTIVTYLVFISPQQYSNKIIRIAAMIKALQAESV